METVVLLPKKNGKTTLLAALALYHIKEWPNALVYIGASSRDQATILFNQAAGEDPPGLVQRSKLEGIFDVKSGYREIRGPKGKVKVLAADAKTQDGVIPTLALVDELHRHPNADLYGVFRDGLDAPGHRSMVTISTAGTTADSPLGHLRAKAHDLPTFKRRGCKNTARSEDGSFVWFEWCLKDTDNRENFRLAKQANPASWHTIETLKRRRNSPTTTPGRWARFACGVWTEGEEQWIESQVWDSLKVDIGEVQEGEPVWVAVRTGQGGGTGLGIAASRDEGVAVRAEVLPYDFPGLDFALRRLVDRYDVRQIYVDGRQFGIGAQVLEDSGLPLAEVPQSPTRLMEATSTFLGLVSSKHLAHDGDLTLRAQVMAGRVKEGVTGAYLEPTSQTSALVAVILAAHEASRGAPEPLVVLPGSVG